MDNRTELLVHVSELYYQQGLSQQEISKIMDMSRPTISRLLDEAKETGVVEIIVHSPILKHAQLSYALRTEFGLRDAVVLAGDYEYAKSLNRCAEEAARFLNTVLDNNQSIGISWGRALEALCDAIKPAEYYNVNVVQMVGCLGTGNPRVDGLELALRISKKLGGTYSNIYAPVYVDSELVYTYLVSEPQIEMTLKKALSVDVVLSGIGSLDDPNGSLYQAGCYTPEDRTELMRRGAVSSLLGRMFDAEGNEVTLDNRYVISAPLEAMRYPSWSIGINASREKAACTLAAVRGRYLNTLIVDEPLAREMLRLAGRPVPD
ncbi:sugar-binding transcriptional regulator [Agathobaculum sp.]|uniref:sugar-binding transcriptional regulator n=1 Tax=Agathobaculum sp. TaxID=2048138 RepID=UPI002A823EF6|nr:sugar-binding domain-containing protein [Agathobaculum sp.]MDY3619176.1 sugar-binding domain-containing protein [Agathobaculum sp.]